MSDELKRFVLDSLLKQKIDEQADRIASLERIREAAERVDNVPGTGGTAAEEYALELLTAALDAHREKYGK